MSGSEKYDMIIDAIRMTASRILPVGSTVSLFGSRARGTHTSDSDWDIHILIPGSERLSLDKADDICWEFNQIGIYEFNERIDAFAYTFFDWERRSFLPFYKNVEKDKIIIFQN